MSSPSRPADPARLLDLAREVAAEAAELAVSLRRRGVEVTATKSSPVDVVTQADAEVERLVRRRLLEARPGDGFLGEEGGEVAGPADGVRWVVDPIDGTVNYLYGQPFWAVSVAAEVAGEVVAGVVHAPALRETFHAVRGQGAWSGADSLQVRDPVATEEALVLTGFNYVTDLRRRQAVMVARMLPRVRDIRRLGACSLDLCSVAAGRADGYVEEGVKPWDFAAGGLVAEEAGARLRQGPGSGGRLLLTCAPAAFFDRFWVLLTESGFTTEEPG